MVLVGRPDERSPFKKYLVVDGRIINGTSTSGMGDRT